MILTIKKLKGMDAGHFSAPFYYIKGLLPHIDGLHVSIHAIKAISSRHAQKSTSRVILESFKLAINTNHYKYFHIFFKVLLISLSILGVFVHVCVGMCV